MNGKEKQYQFNELLLHAIEGDLTPQQCELLNQTIIDEPDAVRHYLEFINLYSELSPYGRIGYISHRSSSDIQKYDLLLKSLASQESTSPSVDVQRSDPESQQSRIGKIEHGRVKYLSLNKASMVSILLSAAAVLLIMLFAYVVPSKSNIEVALLSESLNAKWGTTNMPTRTGTRISTADRGNLLDGIVEFTFDNGVEVILEGPSEVEFLTANEIRLHQGRLFTRVPKTGKGFTVAANNSRVIVFGTEFGVTASKEGSDELHVFKGITTLISGAQREEKTVQEVAAGEAKRVNQEDALVTDIELDKQRFVRHLETAQKLIWRGQNASVAGLMQGTNGLEFKPGVCGINPENGELTHRIELVMKTSNRRYVPVPENPFIDGVFSPVEGQVQITSLNHQSACPRVKDIYTHFVGVIYGPYTEEQFHLSNLSFDGQKYDTSQAPLVFLHSNLGITFDLQAAERMLGLEVVRFQSKAALRQLDQQPSAYVDVWIYVDGQPRLVQKEFASGSASMDIDLPLNENDRFLTLMVTDCSQRSENANLAHTEDCFFLMNPELVLSSRQ